ncbi:hypothetical protein GCM10007103_23290 [Salinimicrobium marinum]|uniref:CpeT/CpcT family n=1 Tax=Salinimicrobium marinum TaxID=680283 RepID=A0A918SIT8_9FLAO|nr:chromophore lyase CpcT/CpeT [Salinimicrobium marinum]GHA41212.1 hypothetical protein GCM10007103_23290 [Salinimicrobium marinum]
MNYLYPLLLLLSISACTSHQESEEEELHGYFQGTFNSKEQSQQDSTYYDITINIVPIWEESEDYWVYAEQALSNSVENPYTQKIYRIDRDEEEGLIMESFEIDNPKEYHGGWKASEIFDSLSPEDLIPMPGCTIYFRKKDDKFLGETRGKECISLSTSSHYSTVQLIISEDKLISWGRGYNVEEQQVWGKLEEGYHLKKIP